MHVNRKLSLRHLQMEEVLQNVVLSPFSQFNKMWFSFARCFLRGSGSVCCPWMVVTGSWRQQRTAAASCAPERRNHRSRQDSRDSNNTDLTGHFD